MPEISREVVALLTYLLPGFLVAWLFYAFTSHPKPASQLERVIQALIFTLLVNALVVGEKLVLLQLGDWVRIRQWDSDAELLASVVTAFCLGFAVAYLTNKDTLHGCLRRLGLSQRSALPNEWCTVLSPRAQFIVLQLKDDRRLYGWPKVWPSDPDKGHMFVTHPSWIHGDEPVELTGTEGILVDVKDIVQIEFVSTPETSQ